jgi:hypothetical protein
MSPLFCAMKKPNMAIVKHLIKVRKYDLSLKSENNINAFLYAAECNKSSEITIKILKRCDNLESHQSAHGFKIIHIAAKNNTFDVINFLLEHTFVNVTTPATRFDGNNGEFLPLQLLEVNGCLSNEQRELLTIKFLERMNEQGIFGQEI